MCSYYYDSNNFDSFRSFLIELNENEDIKSVLLFMAFDQAYSEDVLTPLLKSCTIPIIGGIFPEIIFEGVRKKTGILVIGLPFLLNTQLIHLEGSSKKITKTLKKMKIDTFDTSNGLFVLFDATSEGKNKLTNSLFNYFGTIPTYIGGGAGSLNFETFPCIIDNNGFHKNSAVIGFAHQYMALGASHGWNSISEPLKITKATGNELISINWKPAFEVYKNIVETHSNKKFDATNFFDIAKSYPIGISKMDAEKIVRDPFKKENNSIHFIDSINEGENIEILNGNITSLLNGAKNSKAKAIAKTGEFMQQEFVFSVDCISRALFMEEHFNEEIEIMNYKTKVCGILAIGEIANDHESYLEIYNKTNVIVIW